MYAVIDISSTSISMLVCGKDGARPAYKYRESLSALSFTEGSKLTEHGVEKICDKISVFQDQCKKLGVEKLYVVSTAAMRFIDNAEEVFEAIRTRTGAIVNQIDGDTEAYCDCVANEKFRSMKMPVIIDIGGASIEMCDLTKSGKEGMYCLNFGALTLQRKFVKSVYPDKEECSKIKKYIKKALSKAEVPSFEGGTAVLVGATNRSVYEIYRDYYDIEVSENMTIELEKLKKTRKKTHRGARPFAPPHKERARKDLLYRGCAHHARPAFKALRLCRNSGERLRREGGLFEARPLGRREGPAFAFLPRKAGKRDKIRRRASGTHKIFAQGGKTRGKARRERREA